MKHCTNCKTVPVKGCLLCADCWRMAVIAPVVSWTAAKIIALAWGALMLLLETYA